MPDVPTVSAFQGMEVEFAAGLPRHREGLARAPCDQARPMHRPLDVGVQVRGALQEDGALFGTGPQRALAKGH